MPMEPNNDLLVGAEAIGRFLNCNRRRAFYLLENEFVPAFRIGQRWHARKSTLLRFFAERETMAGVDMKEAARRRAVLASGRGGRRRAARLAAS